MGRKSTTSNYLRVSGVRSRFEFGARLVAIGVNGTSPSGESLGLSVAESLGVADDSPDPRSVAAPLEGSRLRSSVAVLPRSVGRVLSSSSSLLLLILSSLCVKLGVLVLTSASVSLSKEFSKGWYPVLIAPQRSFSSSSWIYSISR